MPGQAAPEHCGNGSKNPARCPEDPQHGLVPGLPASSDGNPPGRPECLMLLWLKPGGGAQTGEPLPQCPGLVTSPWSPLRTVALFHVIHMKSLKMRTPLGKCGLRARQPSALSDGLEMKFALEGSVDGDLGIHCLPSSPFTSSCFISLPPPRISLLSWSFSLLHQGEHPSLSLL